MTANTKRAILPDSDPAAAIYTREDWIDFRDPARISARAGVPRERLPRVVVKELADNALDAPGSLRFGILAAAAGEFKFFVSDDGPGMPGTDAELAARFSIRRPMESSKTRRLPTRGMLGNGTRVIAGVVLISGGVLKVYTKGRCLTLKPEEDGSTTIVSVAPWQGAGTRVEVALGAGAGIAEAAAADAGIFDWAEDARALAGGKPYKGSSSPWWYGDGSFWELLQAAGPKPLVREVERLDGCTARDKIATVVGEWGKRPSDGLTRDEAATVLSRARGQAGPVNPERLGKVGRRDDFGGYAQAVGTFEADGATIPFAVEAWANRSARPGIRVCVNRTPALGQVSLWRTQHGDYAIEGCGFDCETFGVPAKRAGEFTVTVNVISPYVPLVSSGKDPDLSPMTEEVVGAIEKAIRSAQKNCPSANPGGQSQKALIESLLPAAAERLSGNWEYWFSLRQLFYDIRPHLIKLIGKEPSYGTFSKVVGEYEDGSGDVKNLYRDDRGTLHHPHTGEEISLGTRSVAEYQRPPWGFNKVLYCEKEGLFPILRNAGWPERWDCALLSSKGYATRAVRELLRRIKESGEAVTVFCIHDADGDGTVIFEALQRAALPFGTRVINLGLDPDEARHMGLSVEPVKRDKSVRTGSYLAAESRRWLQTNRIELNAMSTPQFLGWLDSKISQYDTGKVVPPKDIIRAHLTEAARAAIEKDLSEQAVRAARVAERVANRIAKLENRLSERAEVLSAEIGATLVNTTLHWTSVVAEAAQTVAEGGDE